MTPDNRGMVETWVDSAGSMSFIEQHEREIAADERDSKGAVFLYSPHLHHWNRNTALGVWVCVRRRMSPINETCPTTHPVMHIWPPSMGETDDEKAAAFARAETWRALAD